MQTPIAPRHPVTIEQLGRSRTDDYAWLKDPNWQAVLRDPAVLRPDIRDHLLAENAYTEAVLADTAALQQTLFDEMVGRIRADDSTVPSPDGPTINRCRESCDFRRLRRQRIADRRV